MTMPLTHAAEKANFRMLNAKPFRYHIPKHKWNICQETQLSSVVRFGLLLLMFLFGFIGATGQGSDTFSQSHEDSRIAQILVAHRDLSPNTADILLSTKRSSKENHKMIVDDDEKHEKEDFNHSTTGKSKSQFLDRKESSRNSNEKNNIKLQQIQFDSYEGGNDKENEDTDYKLTPSEEPMSLAQNFKAKILESRSQLLPVVPIQLPSPDARHQYHYTDDDDSEFNSFSQFMSSHDNFLFGNSSTTTTTPKPKKKKKHPLIHKFVFSDMTEDPEENEDEDEKEEQIKQAAVPIMKTRRKKIPSIQNKNPNVKTNSSDSLIVTSSSEAFPSFHYMNNFLEEYPDNIGYNHYYTRPQHDEVESYQPFERHRGSYYDKHTYYRPNRNRKPNYQDQYNYRISELNSNKYNHYTANHNNHDRDEDEDIHIKGKESNRHSELDEEEEDEGLRDEYEEEHKEKETPLLENPDDEMLEFPTIPNSTSALTSVVHKQILNQPLHQHSYDEDEDDYPSGNVGSTFGMRKTPKTYKSRHRNQHVTTEAPMRNVGRRRKNPVRPFVKTQVNDAREEDSGDEEIRDNKNNDDNQTEITNKLRDSFSNSVGSADADNEDKDFSDGNYNNGLDNTDTNTMMMRRRPRRSVVHLYDMVVCATGCNPLMYKGYGCYCGFLGSGLTVDGIDKCCAKHDWCYHHAKCPPLLTYFVPYYWTCNDNRPKCVTDYRGWKGICGTHLCECDRQFAECLRKFPCPRSRAMCMTSPWRFWQNLLMAPSPPYRYGG